MKAVWIEGEPAELRALAETLSHPYRLFSAGERHLLLVEGVEPKTAEGLVERGGRLLVLEEEGCGKRSGSSR